jgi:hypothetical protein
MTAITGTGRAIGSQKVKALAQVRQIRTVGRRQGQHYEQ